MSLLSDFNFSLAETGLMGQASLAAFAGNPLPPGWNALTPAQLGISPNFWDGNYFTDPSSGASAIVLQQGAAYIVAFRGTDGGNDVSSYPELFTGTYINHYQPLLNALNAFAPSGSNFYFTGASLG